MTTHFRSCPACPTCRPWSAAFLLLAILLSGGTAGAAPKTDVVHFTNGDQLTGEIKGLEKGQLELSTDNVGTVYIEWDKVSRLETLQYIELETSNGTRYHGLVPAPLQEDGTVRLAAAGEAAAPRLPIGAVVRIAPLDQGSFVRRLDGHVSVGFNYAKADNQLELSYSGGVSSRNEIREWSLDGQGTLNTQSTAPSTSMYDLTLGNKRFLRDRWFAQFFATVQGNQELGLDMREVLGAGMGRFLVQDMHSEWSATAGLAYDRENFRDSPNQNSVEGVLATKYSYFRYDTPKRSLDVGLALFPSLTESGRLRAEADVDTRVELVKDLFFQVSLYGSYDSDVDADAPSSVDYGVITSLGYTF
jgi:hypothetical protein